MIQKRNLDPSLLSWLMTLTGLGPGIGEVHYVVPVGSSTSNFYEWLKTDMRTLPANIHHSVTEGEDALTAYRNDVLLVMPGAYDEAAEIAWDKSNTHLIGLAGPATQSDYTEPGVNIYTDTAAVAETIDVTGNLCQFHNIHFCNVGDDTGNLAAFNLDGYGAWIKGCSFSNMMTAGSDGVVAAAALYIDQLGAHCLIEDCCIGQQEWDERTGALSGVLRFVNTSSGGGPKSGTFRRCIFRSRSDTAEVAMVALPASYCIGRGWLMDNCHFTNMSMNNGTNLNQVFYDNCGTTYNIMLHQCSALGIDEWQDADRGNNYIGADMPICGRGGGLAYLPNAVVGT